MTGGWESVDTGDTGGEEAVMDNPNFREYALRDESLPALCFL
jgi:hypothetical protein